MAEDIEVFENKMKTLLSFESINTEDIEVLKFKDERYCSLEM